MPFSNFNRVIYNKKPLITVVCQLRFPRILIINEKQPADFQELIRDKYPLFQSAIEHQQQIQMEIGAKEVSPTPRVLLSEPANNYKFSTIDEKWHVNLTSTFLSLSTSNYNSWEDFLGCLKAPLSALLEVYHPPFYERVGLRYVNAFTRSALNFDNMDWDELIQPFVLGFMSNPDIKSDVRNQHSSVELDIGNGAMAQINTAKGYISDTDSGLPVFSGEESFIVDSDMYMLRKNTNELDVSLTYLHEYSTKLIRSIITEKLHEAMAPRKV